MAVENDAHEFGLHLKQGGWRLGLLVARNVVKAPGRVPAATLAPKVNATTFAKAAGASVARVLRYLDAWETAAEAGLVPPAVKLGPGEEIILDSDTLPAWSEFYDASRAGGYNGGKNRQPTLQNVLDAVDKLSEEEIWEVAAVIEKRQEEETEEGNRDHRAKRTQKEKDEPTRAYTRLGNRIGAVRKSVRQLVLGYQEFKALVTDEVLLEAAEERMLGLQATIDRALGEATSGGYEEALAKITEGS